MSPINNALQIYNEGVSDLLKPDRVGLNIREDRRRGVFVEGLRCVRVCVGGAAAHS